MKISPKQASLLAIEIFKQLQAKKLFAVSPDLKLKVKAFVKKRELLRKENERIEKMIEEHDRTLYKLWGGNQQIRNHWDEDRILSEMEKGNVPTISEISDKILLKAMFASEDDMNSFVESIVKEYTKKVQQKVQQN